MGEGGLRRLTVVLAGAVSVLVLADCRHAPRPCPPARPGPPPRVAQPPNDAATIAAVAAAGSRYDICKPGLGYVITREGTRELAETELRELERDLSTVANGMQSIGIGGVACPPAEPRVGLMVWIDENTVTPGQVAERVAAAAAKIGGDPSFRVQVLIMTAPGPRCAREDPDCGPEPYDARCLEATTYDPNGKRVVVERRGGRPGQCSYDGECVSGGCGNSCVSAHDVAREGTCEEYLGWENVYCGCVQTACVWFTTR